MRLSFVVAVLLWVALVLPGCGANGGAQGTPAAGATASPSPSATETPPPRPPSRADVISVVRAYVLQHSVPGTEIGAVSWVKSADDSRGRLWISAQVASVEGAAADAITVIAYWDKGAWTLYDLGTSVDKGGIPADVRPLL